MSHRPPISLSQVEPLVRAFLEDVGGGVDVARNLEVIAQRARHPDFVPVLVNDQSVDARPTVARRRVARRLAVAAAVLVAGGVGWYLTLSPEPASAYALISGAQSALSTTADRCYLVESAVPKAWVRGNPILRADSHTVVWTRGDRFRVVTNREGRELTWGQDDERRLWVAYGLDRGMRYDHDEVPPMFARTRAYLGLDLRRLAGHFLHQFDLDVEKVGNPGKSRVVIVRATAREGEPSWPFNFARLEIDPKTKVIRKMQLSRVANGTVKVNFTFTLISEASQADGSYSLEGNLPPAAEVFLRDRSEARDELLRELTEARD